MEPALQNERWMLWLDGHVADVDQLNELAESMQADENRLSILMDDLDVHRQLSAWSELTSADDVFVERMLWQYDRQRAERTAKSNGQFNWLVDAASQGPRAADTGTERASASDSVMPWLSSEENTGARPRGSRATKTSQGRRNRNARRHLFVAMTVSTLTLVVAVWAILFALAQKPDGGQAEQPTTPSQAPSESETESQNALVDATGAGATKDKMKERPSEIVPPRSLLEEAIDKSAIADGSRQTLQWIAQVEELGACTWGERRPTDSRVVAGPLDLRAGTVMLRFQNGDEITMTGPAIVDIRSINWLFVKSGSVQVKRTGSDHPMVVQSTASKIEVRPNSRFHLNVDPADESKAVVTEIAVEEGAVQVHPWHGQIHDNVIDVGNGGFNRLRFESASADGPAVARLENGEGEFQGWINVDGRLLKSDDPSVISAVFARAKDRFLKDPQALSREWANLIDSLRRTDRPKTPLSPSLPTNIDEFIERMSKLPGKQQAGGDNPAQDSKVKDKFDQTLIIGGREVHFDNREEYEAARRKLFGAFADIFDSKRREK